jgi:creatinine amidohydrolase/Fe(II)-dependent formamide hydrolase-like protein
MHLRLITLLFAAWLCLPAPVALAATPASLYLEDLSWTELREAIAAGHTSIIIPIGGTEQNGPHMALGKHNARARLLAGRIAAELGNALVAPVVAYVPEGSIDPPAAHMRYPGTISISDATFAGLLDGAARSFRQAGFRDVVLIGDHGGYQPQLKAAADRLNRAWAGAKTRAHFIDAYYRSSTGPYAKALRDKGLSEAQIGVHAASADTSLQLALDPTGVRLDRLAQGAEPDSGVNGDPRAANAALGQIGVELIVARSVAAIRHAIDAAPR